MGQRHYALVVFGASTTRPTIVCLHEEAIPAEPGPNWLILARDTDLLPRDTNVRCATEHTTHQGDHSAAPDPLGDRPD